jgi:hypothetical protein
MHSNFRWHAHETSTMCKALWVLVSLFRSSVARPGAMGMMSGQGPEGRKAEGRCWGTD